MRRLIQAAAVVGTLIPAVAFAQSTNADTNPGDPSRTTPAAGAPTTLRRANRAAHGADDGIVSTSGSTNDSAENGQNTGSTTTGNGSTASGLSDRDSPEGSAAAETAPTPLPFRSSQLIIDHSISTETIFPGSQLTPEPSFQTWISFRPRWYLTNDLSIRGRADVTVEWIENAANTDTHLREPELNDFSLDLAWTGLAHLISRSHITPSLGIGIAVPTSLTSRYRGVWFLPGTVRVSAGATRKFEHIGPGDLTVGLSFIGMHAFTSSTTPVFQGPGYACDSAGDLPTVCHAAGSENPAFTLWSFISAGYTVRNFGVNFSYVLINNWVYGTPDTTLTPNDGMSPPVTVQRSANDQRLRQSGWFFASADYDITRWLTASIGYYCFRPILDPTGNYGNPFWAPDGSSRIFLTATLNLDSVYDAFYRVATGHERGANPHATASTNNGRRAHDAMVQQLTGMATF